MLKYVDVHSHILHQMDDGPQHVETSVKMLEAEYRQQVETVIVTPHFKDFDSITIDEFLAMRAQRVQEIEVAAKEKGVTIPKLCQGAEVTLSCDISEIPDIEKLVIEGTRYILIEMPYTAWQDWMFDSLYALIAHKDLIPVMAHMERYYDVDRKKIEKLGAMDVYFQINADSLGEKVYRNVAMKLIRNNMVHLIGSDTHNLDTRAPKLRDGYKFLEKKVSGEFAHYLNVNGHLLLDDEYIEKYAANYHQMSPFGWFRRLFG